MRRGTTIYSGALHLRSREHAYPDAPPPSPLFPMVRPDKPIASSREGETASRVHCGSRGRAAAGGLRAAAGAGPGFSGSDAPPPSGGGAQPWPQVTPERGPLWTRREVRALW